MGAARGLPAEPLGPESLFWEHTGDWRTLLLAARALVLQTAHPMVGAAVGQQSVYKDDPYGRLDRTLRSVMRQIYGGAAAAEEGARLRRLHRGIRGVDDRGRRYSALDPGAYLWVHATIFEAYVQFYRLFVRPLTDAELRALYDDWRRVGVLLGIRADDLPPDVAAFWAYWDAALDVLEDNPVVQDILHEPPRRPRRLPLPDRAWRLLLEPSTALARLLTAATLPDELRRRFGLPEVTPLQRQLVQGLAVATRVTFARLPEPLRFMPVAVRYRRAARRRPLRVVRTP